ncbi:MAG: exonuclease SbcCD subunit D [Saprospiraceae bacterium]|nr:exonuclease SbcCD subunit D [Saprospiraceae bacterium]
MKIIHFSDTHLGYQAYDVVNTRGINAREQDLYDAFEAVIDQILVIRPDVVVHSGDFFHRPSPSNRALTLGLEQLRRLCDARIPVVIIAGNHETPKTIYTSPILRALRSLECVVPVFGEQYEVHEFGELAVHGVPHINDDRLLQQELARLQPLSNRWNLLLLHTSLGKTYLMEEYGEQIYPPEFIEKLAGFQYVALGHWHNFQQTSVVPQAWYAGSTERMSDTEIGAEKGFVELDALPDGGFKMQFHPIKTRPWLKLDLVNCQNKIIAELQEELLAFRSANNTSQAIISINFNEIKAEQAMELSNIRLRQIFPDSFQILPKRRLVADRNFAHQIEANQFDRLDGIFADYLRSRYPDNLVLAEKLVERARHYFNPHQT